MVRHPCTKSPLPGAALPPVPPLSRVTLRQRSFLRRGSSPVFPLVSVTRLGSTGRLRGFVLLYESEVFIEETVAVVADGNVVSQKYDFLRRMRTGFLFFGRHQIDLRNCSYFFVWRRRWFGWFCATTLVALDH